MTDVTTADEFSTALTHLVPRLFGADWRLSALHRLSGGASKETWAFDATDGGARRRLILRRAPPHANARMGGAELETEAALMRLAGAAGVPSPHVLHVLSEADDLGQGFVMAHVAGETIARKILRDEAFARLRPRLARELGGILARLHAIAVDSLPPLGTVTAAEELAHMRETYRADGQPRPVFEYAFRWLADHAPAEPPPSLVHGDFRLGNFIVDGQGVRAILDWELAHLGDPLRDIGWICTGSWRFGGIDKPVGGFGELSDLVAGYEDAGGARVDLARVKFWEIFGSLRWGVMCLSMLARYERGGDRTIERAMIGRRASETEIDLLRLLLPRS
ncbi:phosphotransferase family protein [Bradyrhizobium sp. 2TAF24]|uniref:phosphotransferase family protein n=1 Tax=Bradyrhizobium sp. 2TAF24 TaxID=3233011 RepID=UPI003F9043A3